MPERWDPRTDPIDYTRGVQFDPAGKPFNVTRSGRRMYMSPVIAMQSRDPRAVEWARGQGVFTQDDGEIVNNPAGKPGYNYLKTNAEWDPNTGGWDQDTDWANILTTAGAGGVIGAGIGAVAGSVAGGGAPAAGAESGVLASSNLPVTATAAPGASSTVAGGIPGAVSGGSSAAPASAYSRLLSRDTLGAASRGLGAYSQGQAMNRGQEFAGQVGLERVQTDRDALFFDQQLDREREGREGGRDAWARLQSAQRTLSPGARPQLSPYSVAPRQHTDAERTGAQAMSDEVMARLMGGNPIPKPVQRPLSVDPRLLKPGTSERITGYLSPILSGISAYYGGR